jgi:CitMHS family citrate-Mg2+:H+ or citrate-Ca2+:H+ symporter
VGFTPTPGLMNSLTLLAYGMIIVFMALIMTKRMSVLTALALVPIVFGVIAGFGPKLGPMMLDGIKALAPTGVMLTFAILYFGIMIDAGLFDPVVKLVVRLVHGDPVKIVVGTAALALFVSLDGDGSTTYLITTTAMLPLYMRLKMDRLVLASVIMQAGGVMNILPWGGPTARAAAALKLDMGQVFPPLVISMIVGAAWVLFVAWLLGRRERKRLGILSESGLSDIHASMAESGNGEDASIRRPKLVWVNMLLTVALLVALIAGLLPLPVLFLVAFALALVINYPSLEEQKARIAANAGNALAVVSVIFAAGIFTGILSGTKMVDAIAGSVVAMVPPALGPYLAVITGILSMPFTFFLSNDAFYFGVLPILTEAASHYGISAAEMARASLVGQPVHLLSPLVPSTYLLVGLAKVEFGDHQKFTIKWTVATSLMLLLVNLLIGVIPLVGRVP